MGSPFANKPTHRLRVLLPDGNYDERSTARSYTHVVAVRVGDTWRARNWSATLVGAQSLQATWQRYNRLPDTESRILPVTDRKVGRGDWQPLQSQGK